MLYVVVSPLLNSGSLEKNNDTTNIRLVSDMNWCKIIKRFFAYKIG